jgi:hypothetical protein
MLWRARMCEEKNLKLRMKLSGGKSRKSERRKSDRKKRSKIGIEVVAVETSWWMKFLAGREFP